MSLTVRTWRPYCGRDGHPDLQGVWATKFVTMQERPPGVPGLVATPEQAAGLVGGILGGLPDNVDPDVSLQALNELLMVKGEYRTSIVVDPANGQIPFSQKGGELAAWVLARDEGSFDRADQRPLVERCLENWGACRQSGRYRCCWHGRCFRRATTSSSSLRTRSGGA